LRFRGADERIAGADAIFGWQIFRGFSLAASRNLFIFIAMTIEEIIGKLNSNATGILIFLAFAPLLALLLNAMVTAENYPKGLKYGYSTALYAACLPGICALLLTLYSFFFLRQNMLQVNIWVYFLPIISMLITLAIIRRKIPFDKIPGSQRISSFLLLVAVSFILTYLLQKTQIYIGIFALMGMKSLLILFAVIFFVLYYSWNKLMGKK
jgi:hypothetical protein